MSHDSPFSQYPFRKKEPFVPLDPKGKVVKIYSCGPTVYGLAHIGNFRSFLVSDLLVRVLQYAGYEVIKAQNITDVGHLTGDDTADASGEDKIEKRPEKKNWILLKSLKDTLKSFLRMRKI
ncbi:arginine--tRNA ligase [Candidatus Gracilibacteria bacterium]|nr:arginine--tRNA ligase [Candidatus Gracilibacteria bacterium]